MSSEEGIFSTLSAQVVVEYLVAVVKHPGSFVGIDVIERDHAGTETVSPTVWLAPTEDDVFVLADDSEIIQCTTREGFRASVLVGKPDTRSKRKAKIVLGS